MRALDKFYSSAMLVALFASILLCISAIAQEDHCNEVRMDQAACEQFSDCLYFTELRTPSVKPRKQIGCLAVPITKCGPFWSKEYCELPIVSDSCVWNGKKCMHISKITSSPTSSPTWLDECQKLNDEECATTEGCTLFNGVKGCDDKGTPCKKFNYGCQRSTFCGFKGKYVKIQCRNFPDTCKWYHARQECGPVIPTDAPTSPPPTSAPTTTPPTPPPSCEVATDAATCEIQGNQCRWFGSVRDCPLGKTCDTRVKYGCQARAFCTFAKGRYLGAQCALFKHCFFDKESKTCMMLPVTDAPTKRPTAYPTTFAPTNRPTSRPSNSPTSKPTKSPSRSPTHRPSRNPSPAPSKAPTTSRPTFSPSKTPTGTPSSSPSTSPSAAPTRSPTFTDCIAATSADTCDLLAGDSGRCEWVAPKVCNANNRNCKVYTYGCQDRGFCDLTLPGSPKAQCSARKEFCFWDQKAAKCSDICAGKRPRGPNVRTMCGTTTIPAQSLPGRSIRLLGTNFVDHTGKGLAGDADFDGDGLKDLVIGVPDAPPKIEGRDGTGSVNLLLGSLGITTRSRSPRQTALNDGHYRINGTLFEGQFGDQVIFADLDADGLSDLIVSAPLGSPLNRDRAGEVYIIWGRKDFAEAWAAGEYANLNSAHPRVVLRIPGETPLQTFGSALSTAGDFDKDGYTDIIIGSRDAGAEGRAKAGVTFILYGGPRESFIEAAGSNPLVLSKVRHTRILGYVPFGGFGSAVSGGGDVNADGYADVIVGAPWAGHPAGTGDAFVIFGRRNPPSVIDLKTASPITEDGTWSVLVLLGESKQSGWANFGAAVSILGDVNADGIDDFAVSSPRMDTVANAKESGRVYIYFGRQHPVASLSPVDLTGEAGGFVVDSTGNGDFFGSSLASGFVDFNGDGYADVVIGAPSKTTGVQVGGEVAIIYGRCTNFPASLNTKKPWSAAIGTLINGKRAKENMGVAVASAGDLDGDGRTDLLFGAHFSDRERGAAYLVFSCQ